MSAGPHASQWLMSCTGTPRKQGSPALRQELPAPSANGTLSRKRSLEQRNGNRSVSGTPSSSDDEDARSAPEKRHLANGAARKKRRNVLPVIRANQRCGKCRTCLNPQVPCLLLCSVPSALICTAACST